MPQYLWQAFVSVHFSGRRGKKNYELQTYKISYHIDNDFRDDLLLQSCFNAFYNAHPLFHPMQLTENL